MREVPFNMHEFFTEKKDKILRIHDRKAPDEAVGK
jgi:hypothetical protein